MAGERYSEFMQLRGRRILDGVGSRWYSNSMGIYMSIPYHEVYDPPEGELERFMWRTHMLGVRFPSSQYGGLASGVYVRRKKPYDLSSVQPRLRTQVRRGLENCQICQIDSKELLTGGLRCNLDTMQRQGRFDAEFGEQSQWGRLVRAVSQCAGIAAYGAFVEQKLAAYAITCREDGWLHILHQMSCLESLNYSPNHALTFHVTRDGLADPGIDAVCFGLRGLVAGYGLNDYKLRLGYEIVPQTSVFVLHPGVGRLFSSALAIDGIAWLRKLRPHNQRFGQIESVLTGARLTRLGSAASTLAKTAP
jgi:hypothetical protein